jgi:Fibronectin type III domain
MLEHRHMLTQVAIDFADYAYDAAPGYLQDSGEAFDTQWNGMRYGWVNSSGTPTANINTFNRPDNLTNESRKRSGIETQIGGNRTWEIELPNGQYNVRLTSGDPGNSWQIKLHSLVEGQEIVNFQPTNQQSFATGTLNNVSVTDGRLTITNGSTALNNRITHVEIVSVAVANTPAVAAPSNLSWFQPEGTQLDLRWRDNSNNEDLDVGFKIQRATSASGPWTQIGTAYANAQLFTVNNVSGNFFYRVVAVKGTQEAASNVVSFNAGLQAMVTSGLGYTPQFGNEASLPYFAWQAEDYNRGGQQQAYSDTTAGNAGGFWRSGNGDIGSMLNPLAPSELERTGFVGWTRQWEWQRYAFNGPTTTGQFRFELRYATPDAGGTILLSSKRPSDPTFIDKTGELALPATGNFRNFSNITSNPFTIDAYNDDDDANFQLQNFSNTVSGRWNANLDWFRVFPANAPSELTAQAVSSSQINLTWRDNATTETGYVVERSTSLDFTQGLTTFNVGANSTTFSSTGLVANTVYFYRVRAVIGGSNTTSTYWAQAKTLNATQPVLPVVTVTPSPTSVQENGVFVPLRFTRTGGDIPNTSLSLTTSFGAAGDTAVANTDFFPVFWGPGGPNSGSSPFSQIFFPPGQSQVDVTIQILDNTIDNTGPNKFFTVSIQPSEFVYAQGNPAASVVTIVDDEGGGPPSGSVDSVKVYPGSTLNSLELEWTTSSVGLPVTIYRSVGDVFDDTSAIVLASNWTLSSYTDSSTTSLAPARFVYAIQPTASNDGPGSEAAFAFAQLGGPERPDNLFVERIDERAVQLTWRDNSLDRRNSVVRYRVQIKAQLGGWTDVVVLPGNRDHYLIDGLSPSSVYSFRVEEEITLDASPSISQIVGRTGEVEITTLSLGDKSELYVAVIGHFQKLNTIPPSVRQNGEDVPFARSDFLTPGVTEIAFEMRRRGARVLRVSEWEPDYGFPQVADDGTGEALNFIAPRLQGNLGIRYIGGVGYSHGGDAFRLLWNRVEALRTPTSLWFSEAGAYIDAVKRGNADGGLAPVDLLPIGQGFNNFRNYFQTNRRNAGFDVTGGPVIGALNQQIQNPNVNQLNHATIDNLVTAVQDPIISWSTTQLRLA